MSADTRAVKATVLVPTHEHGPLLAYSVRSALAQTVRDLEVLIVGDGVDDATRHVACEMAALDPRVHFFDLPKGPRRGEVNRREALRSARGEIVLYLSDDDLWLPRHVEVMAGVLRSADFAHAVPVNVEPDQCLSLFPGHLLAAGIRDRLYQRWNFIPLSAGAHTRDLYDRLSGGWDTSPDNVWADLHMWRRLLAVEGCRVGGAGTATILHFPDPYRRSWPMDQREGELERWSRRLADPGFAGELQADVLTQALVQFAGHFIRVDVLESDARERREAAALVEAERERLSREVGALRARVTAMEGSLTWRGRNRLLAWPRVASALRALSRGLRL